MIIILGIFVGFLTLLMIFKRSETTETEGYTPQDQSSSEQDQYGVEKEDYIKVRLIIIIHDIAIYTYTLRDERTCHMSSMYVLSEKEHTPAAAARLYKCGGVR